MIKNDRQHKIIGGRLQRLEGVHSDLVSRSSQRKFDGKRAELERRALRAEMKRMRAELEEYEALKEGRAEVGQAETIADLPRLLIRARIAAGLTQAELATRLGIKEQQIQRYEATDYESASLSRLREVAAALRVKLGGSLPATEEQINVIDLLRRCEQAGLDRRFVLDRFGLGKLSGPSALVSAVARLAHVFGWSPNDILTRDFQPDTARLAPSGFKMPRRTNQRRAAGLTVYAHHLVQLVLRATKESDARLELDPVALHRRIAQRGTATFARALEAVWDLGVPVLPLDERGGFHAAYWRIGGRGVIVLNPMRPLASLWLFDLLHECGHAREDSSERERLVLEDTPGRDEEVAIDREREANQYANEAIFGGRSSELFERVMEMASGRVDLVQRAVRNVARVEDIDAGMLALNVAHLLSERGHSWWGAAMNLQDEGPNPLEIAREILTKRLQWSKLDPLDADLLARALDAPTGRHVVLKGER